MARKAHYKIGVIAGTPVDTRFGVEFLERKGIRAYGVPISYILEEQTTLQLFQKTRLTEKVLITIEELMQKKIDAVIIYCNSLSASIYVNKLRKLVPIPIITPLDVYKIIAKKHNLFGLIAASCNSTAVIEKIIIRYNNRARVIGLGNTKLVHAVEDKMKPSEIVKKFSLKQICKMMSKCGCKTIVLGCTHFNHFAKELELLKYPIFDPSDEMLDLLLEKLE